MHAIVGDPDWSGDETLDPKRSILSERHQGTFAEQVVVPRRNLVPEARRAVVRGGGLPADRLADRLPDALHRRPACRPVTGCSSRAPAAASRPPRSRSAAPPGSSSGSTGRDEAKRQRALELGAHEVFEPGARLPARVDAVLETVGKATWAHSMKSLRPGGTLVVSGRDDRRRPVGRPQPAVLPAAAGARLDDGDAVPSSRGCCGCWPPRGVRPQVDEVVPLSQAARGFERLVAGDVVGKVVLTA